MKTLRIAFSVRKRNYCISGIALLAKDAERGFETGVISSHMLTTNSLKS